MADRKPEADPDYAKKKKKTDLSLGGLVKKIKKRKSKKQQMLDQL